MIKRVTAGGSPPRAPANTRPLRVAVCSPLSGDARYRSADGAYLAICELDDLETLKAPHETTKSDIIHIDSVMTCELLP